MTVKLLDVFFAQQMIPAVLFSRDLTLLDELPDSDGRYSQNFSRTFGGDKIHQISVLEN